MNKDKFVVVGKIGAPYGVKGFLKLYSLSQTPEKLRAYSKWYCLDKDKWVPLLLDEIKPYKNHLIIKIQGINDRDAAAYYRNREIAVYRSQLPEIKEGEYYWTDLEGLTVITKDGQTLGNVDHLIEAGSNDVLVVKGDRIRMIPFVKKDVILAVDLDQQTIIVDWDPEF